MKISMVILTAFLTSVFLASCNVNDKEVLSKDERKVRVRPPGEKNSNGNDTICAPAKGSFRVGTCGEMAFTASLLDRESEALRWLKWAQAWSLQSGDLAAPEQGLDCLKLPLKPTQNTDGTLSLRASFFSCGGLSAKTKWTLNGDLDFTWALGSDGKIKSVKMTSGNSGTSSLNWKVMQSPNTTADLSVEDKVQVSWVLDQQDWILNQFRIESAVMFLQGARKSEISTVLHQSTGRAAFDANSAQLKTKPEILWSKSTGENIFRLAAVDSFQRQESGILCHERSGAEAMFKYGFGSEFTNDLSLTLNKKAVSVKTKKQSSTTYGNVRSLNYSGCVKDANSAAVPALSWAEMLY